MTPSTVQRVFFFMQKTQNANPKSYPNNIISQSQIRFKSGHRMSPKTVSQSEKNKKKMAVCRPIRFELHPYGRHLTSLQRIANHKGFILASDLQLIIYDTSMSSKSIKGMVTPIYKPACICFNFV